MLLTLLAIGTYSMYKFIDLEDKKVRLNNLMKDCDMNRDEDFMEFLRIMKTSPEKIIAYDEYAMRDMLFHSEKNLKTIPYLSDDQIDLFKKKVWTIRAKHFVQEREKIFESASKSMKKFEEEFSEKPTHREVLSIRQLYMPSDLKKLRYTYFGKLVYCPDGGRFYSKTDRYTNFVVSVPAC